MISVMANWISAVFTIVIAAATVVYVIFTQKLWQETKRSADAAKDSAEAAKVAAEISATLHRPFMGLHRAALQNGDNWQHDPGWRISWGVSNFGTLPAIDVETRMALCLGDRLLYEELGTGGAEVFPQADPLESITVMNWKNEDRDRALSGSDSVVLRVRITYASPSGQKFKHTANAKFDRGFGTFTISQSKTETTSSQCGSSLPALLHEIYRNQPLSLLRIIRPTAPRPIFRALHQSPDYRIRKHIVQFFLHFPGTVYMKIVKSCLPKLPAVLRDPSQTQRKTVLVKLTADARAHEGPVEEERPTAHRIRGYRAKVGEAAIEAVGKIVTNNKESSIVHSYRAEVRRLPA